MKIGIRADLIGSNAGGAETYLRSSTEALAHDARATYALVTNEQMSVPGLKGFERCEQLIIPRAFIHLKLPFQSTRLPVSSVWLPTGATSLALARNHIDLIHVQTADPFVRHPRLVVTLHDIAFERFPKFFTPEYVKKIRIRVALTVRRARAIITSSHFSKNDIVRRYVIDPDRVFVARGAAAPQYKPITDVEHLTAIRRKYGTGDHFILCVGDLQPRKNLTAAIEAFIALRRSDVVTHKLVIVGRKAWLYDTIFDSVRESGYAPDIVFTGYVLNDDLPGLYSAADVFVYPSLFEGFGLPPLEAMACGTAVVCSNRSSLPEVVGDAAITVDPCDISALTEALGRVLTDDMVKTSLIDKGLERARIFTWDKTADVIYSAYEYAMKVPR